MTISAVSGQAAGINANVATSVSLAFGANVTAGNLITVGVYRWNGTTSDPIIQGDFTKSAGTCTVGTFQLHHSVEWNYSGTNRLCAAIASVRVTGSGTCTIQVAGAPASSWFGLGINEYRGNWAGQANLLDFGTGQAATGNPVPTALRTAYGAILLSVLNHASNGQTLTQDSNWSVTYKEQGATNQNGGIIERLVQGPAVDDGDWTSSVSNFWLISEAALGEAYDIRTSGRQLYVMP